MSKGATRPNKELETKKKSRVFPRSKGEKSKGGTKNLGCCYAFLNKIIHVLFNPISQCFLYLLWKIFIHHQTEVLSSSEEKIGNFSFNLRRHNTYFNCWKLHLSPGPFFNQPSLFKKKNSHLKSWQRKTLQTHGGLLR